ncbi:MAG: DUF3109 family protein [Bacteroidia bacterium]|jgi:hypothetical protein
MIQVENLLISEDLFEVHFVCDLQACKGACCVEGDGGAPLREDELNVLEEIQALVRPFLPASGKAALEKEGAWVIDSDGDYVTPLVEGKHCAYTVFSEDGKAHCGIELAWKAGKTTFQKPLSCHLYPIRVQKLADTEALNYHTWSICKPACTCGSKLRVPLYKFLKEPLIRAYGAAWYAMLPDAAEAWETYKRENAGN